MTEPLGSAQVCDRLGIDRSTLTRWVAAGRIAPLYKAPGIRGTFVFDSAEVERIERDRRLADTG